MPNRLQPKLAIACAKGGGSLLNWMNFSSLPANFEERKIVGLSKPYNFGVGRDGAVQTGSPVMCEEETIENSSNLLSVPVLGRFCLHVFTYNLILIAISIIIFDWTKKFQRLSHFELARFLRKRWRRSLSELR